MSKRGAGRLVACALALAVVASAPSASAQTTWEGDESSDWAAPGNWTDGVPDASDTVTIPPGLLANEPAVLASCAPCSAGSIAVLEGRTLRITDGTLNAAGDLSSDGTVQLGLSPGALNVSGSYTQGAGATFAAAVHGTAAGAFGVLNVSGNVALAGTLALLPGGAFVDGAVTGDSVGLLEYGGTRSGAFAATTATPVLAGDKPFGPSYDDASTVVRAVVGSPPATDPPPSAPPSAPAPPPAPVAVTAPRPPALSAPGSRDRTAPAARIGGPRSQKLARTVRVTVACTGEACTATVDGTVRVPKLGARKAKTYALANVTRRIARGRSAAIGLRLSTAARIAIGRALAAGQRVNAQITIRVSDAAGNLRKLKRTVKLEALKTDGPRAADPS